MTSRTDAYKKDPSKEFKLEEINLLLQQPNNTMLESFIEPKHPLLFIVGAPRSATTLTHQFIAQTSVFSYISNFTAKFWKAPYLGMVLEDLMETQNEIISNHSNFGRTSGLHEPHQFNYFWKDWFKYDGDHQMDDSVINSIANTNATIITKIPQ